MSSAPVNLAGPEEKPLEAWLRYWHFQERSHNNAAYAIMARQSQYLTLPDSGNSKTEVHIDHTAYSGLLEI
ncbi:hypothetical protein RHMOL_Rhmol05G0113700 [Rhododendron molle]|uniref:Uncharacterized protein n=1 Tax=Rhododendron molle TaxID=49168 RepID=A0ACC0NMX8_RHOML|nr:hypothetical protein RHMOL_Rhmol05G0113700 [Rhododendron molle]